MQPDHVGPRPRQPIASHQPVFRWALPTAAILTRSGISGLSRTPDEVRRTRDAKTTRSEWSAVMVVQGIQIVGAVAILAAFVCVHLGKLDTRSNAYLIPNLVGSTVLAAQAWMTGQLGFVLLEGVWALVSAYALLRGSANA
jgi:hypothetical protein